MDPEQNTQTQENTFPATEAERSNKNMILIGGIAVLVILAGLGWYMLKSINMTPPLDTPAPLAPETAPITPEATTDEQNSAAIPDAATAALSTQGTSDELGSIEADLNATDLNSLNDINKI